MTVDNKRKKKKGFTLVELIVVLAIIGVISAIAAPTILSKVDEAKKEADVANASSIAMVVKSGLAEGALAPDSDGDAINSYVSKHFEGNTPISQVSKAAFTVSLEKNGDNVTGVDVSRGTEKIYPVQAAAGTNTGKQGQ